MPAVKKTTKRTRKPAQSSTRTMSPADKRALAEGRAVSATVDRYLSAVNTPKRRGRKVSKAVLESRLAAAQAKAKTMSGIEKLVAAQEVRDLRTRIAAMNSARGSDIAMLEAAFVKVAKQFSENRGITYASWRDAGVPAAVLKKAGIARTRG